jgi:hypothetical protein
MGPLVAQFHRDIVSPHRNSNINNKVVKALLSNLRITRIIYGRVVVVIELMKFECFLTADGEPGYAGLDSNPELESEPTHLSSGIQNETQSVTS